MLTAGTRIKKQRSLMVTITNWLTWSATLVILAMGKTYAYPLPLNYEFKKDFFEYCASGKQSRAICLNEMAEKYIFVKEASESGRKEDALRFCFESNINQTSNSLSASVNCTTDILKKMSQSQYDEVAFFPYLKSTMRPYWVSRCAKKDMSELNKCLDREEYSFSEFLNDYLKPGTLRTEKKTACLKLLDDTWDFAKANNCNR